MGEQTHYQRGRFRITTVTDGEDVRVHTNMLGQEHVVFFTPDQIVLLVSGLNDAVAAVRSGAGSDLLSNKLAEGLPLPSLAEILAGPPGIDRLLARHGQPSLPESSVEDLLPGSPTPEPRRPKHAYAAPAPTHERRLSSVAAVRWEEARGAADVVAWLQDNGYRAKYHLSNGVDYTSTARISVQHPDSRNTLRLAPGQWVLIHSDRSLQVMDDKQFAANYERL